MGFIVTVNDGGLLNKLDDAPDEVNRLGSDFLGRLEDVLVTAVKDETPVDEGTLRDSMGGETDVKGDEQTLTIKSIGVKEVVVASVTHGTRPHFPPIRAITPWAVRHNINPWALAKAIARRGTIARFGSPSHGAEMFQKGFDNSEERISTEVFRFDEQLQDILD